jgi:hypothetical protein
MLGSRSIAFPLMGRGHRLAHAIIAEGVANAVNEMHALPARSSLERLVLSSLHEDDLERVRAFLDPRPEL